MSLGNIDKLKRLVEKRGNPFRVLIVDDEKWVRDVFKDFCELTDSLEVEMATGGVDAIAKVRATRYDLITLDLIMPEMSGLEVLAAIKQTAPHVPVMIITGNATDKIINEAGLLGACSVLYKPIMLENFVSEVVETLTR